MEGKMLRHAGLVLVAVVAMSFASPAMADHCKGKHKNDPGCEVSGNNESFAIYEELFVGEEYVVENGPLSLIVRCQAVSTGPASAVILIISSTVDDWLVGGLTDTLRAAGEFSVQSTGESIPRMNFVSGMGGVAPTGHYVSFDGNIGVNMGSNCFAAGQVTSSQAP
jgi:hypothetical protein